MNDTDKIDDSGPAFPNEHRSDGMSLREYFAGQALLAVRIANPSLLSSALARSAISDADALIAEMQRARP